MYLRFPLLLHVIGEHCVEDRRPRRQDDLVAGELLLLADDGEVREVAITVDISNVFHVLSDTGPYCQCGNIPTASLTTSTTGDFGMTTDNHLADDGERVIGKEFELLIFQFFVGNELGSSPTTGILKGVLYVPLDGLLTWITWNNGSK